MTLDEVCSTADVMQLHKNRGISNAKRVPASRDTQKRPVCGVHGCVVRRMFAKKIKKESKSRYLGGTECGCYKL